MTEQNRKWSESDIHDQVGRAGLDNANAKTKRHFIVVEKYGDHCMEYERDEVLLSSTTDGNTLFSTTNNGTILITPTGAEFGSNCPNGVAVYGKL